MSKSQRVEGGAVKCCLLGVAWLLYSQTHSSLLKTSAWVRGRVHAHGEQGFTGKTGVGESGEGQERVRGVDTIMIQSRHVCHCQTIKKGGRDGAADKGHV